MVKVPLMEAAGLRFLLNENVSLRRGAAELYLLGIDDPNHYKTHDFKRALRQVPESGCKVLLLHSPETYDEAEACGIDFQMSGHTHGGQLCLPGERLLVHHGSAPRALLAGVMGACRAHSWHRSLRAACTLELSR